MFEQPTPMWGDIPPAPYTEAEIIAELKYAVGRGIIGAEDAAPFIADLEHALGQGVA